MNMSPDDISDLARVAQYYNPDDAVFEKEKWRFKHTDTIDKGVLQSLRHADVIAKWDGWQGSQTTWTWTERGERFIETCDTSAICNLSDEQLSALERHAATVVSILGDSNFSASEYNLIGQTLQTLSDADILVKHDTEAGAAAEWSVNPTVERALASV